VLTIGVAWRILSRAVLGARARANKLDSNAEERF
jgi:hypothetical protein